MALERKTKTKQVEEDDVEAPASAASTSTSADAAAETDDLLDEIDSVLEENAEAFVQGYVQKGGE